MWTLSTPFCTYRRVSVRFLKGEPSPPIEDVQRWVTGGAAEAGTPEDLQKVATMADNSEEKAERFTAGDPVYVADSDLQNLEGRVKAIPPQGVISVGDLFDPTEGKYLPETLDFRPSQLRKNFKTGDFVRVTVGQHKGETGMVSHVDKGVCTIFTDIGKEEIQVHPLPFFFFLTANRINVGTVLFLYPFSSMLLGASGFHARPGQRH